MQYVTRFIDQHLFGFEVLARGAETGLADIVSGSLEGGLSQASLKVVADPAGSGEVLGVVGLVSLENCALFVVWIDCLAIDGLLHLI